MSLESYEGGQSVIEQGERSDDVFFVHSGALRAIMYSADGRAVIFRDLGPLDTFGELAALDKALRSTSIVALTAVESVQAPGRAFRKLIDRDPTVVLALLTKAVDYVRELSGRIHEFGSLAVQNRIHAELLRFAMLTQSKTNQAELTPAPNLADIAGRICTHREAVSREVSRLSKQGLLERRGKSLVVKDIARLTAMVQAATGTWHPSE